MNKNMGTADRLLRSALAVVVGGLYFGGVIDGTTALVLGIFAAIFILTSLVSYCPLYPLVGFSTCSKEKKGS